MQTGRVGVWVEHPRRTRFTCPECERELAVFPAAFFDAAVNVASYHYFGTDIRYLSYLAQFVRAGGLIAIVVSGNAIDPAERTEYLTGQRTERHGADWFTFGSGPAA
ncbi:MAG: hypothetical protein ACYDAQ_18485 [Mycobacteriales bacterium]